MNRDSEISLEATDRRSRKREEKRQTIIAAAERIFHEKDLSHISMEEIAREADVAAGTLYNYFPGKEALFLEVFVNKLTPLFDEALAEWESDAPFKEKLRLVVNLHMSFIHSHKGFYEFLMTLGQPDFTAPGPFTGLVELCEGYLTRQTRAFERAQKSGEISNTLSPKFLARALRSLCWGMATEAVNRRKTQDLDSEVEPILELFWKGITQ
ncbi:transcriptional regulator, TetR family [Rubritalea squalenifaciens DSM 18772]|uniref:Transcriptional regulator, TetR family n=1 Tax=Rubritalea squalenifaciens DSM 18772 TaxID=1123071 RepID=A0A1M6DSB3_9BACT|nr:TetR/AcrR family transcriptional regulator [Rubritalea squalenifaciens]SHI76137.1 transcriptional regulator, TetR family [Rubritalea squalenifaciens DSM 18772]